MRPESVSLLVQGLHDFGIEAPGRAVAAISSHLAMVAEWNERINLTAIRDEEGMVLKHVLDSATALLLCPLQKGMRVIDVGSGAGFPGVTLKLLVPGVQMVLLDSLQKRCRFLEAVREQVIIPFAGSSPSTEVIWGRAEEAGHQKTLRETAEVVVGRAVAELRILAEFCLPFVKVGGRMLAMKGPEAEQEVENARRAVAVLGGEFTELRRVSLPGGAGERTLVLIAKRAPTPPAYPRRAGLPERKPL
jgi:16S rRNA (guanine527-N7)-methyltransferase